MLIINSVYNKPYKKFYCFDSVANIEIYLRGFKMPQIRQWLRVNPCDLFNLRELWKLFTIKEELKKNIYNIEKK